MKKVFFIVFIFFVVAFFSMNTAFIEYLASLEENAEITFYCSTKQSNMQNFEQIKNGEGYIYITKLTNLDSGTILKNDCYGFSIKFFDEKNFEKVLSRIYVLKSEVVEDKTIFYGIANGLCFSNFVNLRKVNVQVAKCQDYFVVGCPLILGSY